MTCIGIDPGLSGAIAIIGPMGSRVVDVPIMRVEGARKRSPKTGEMKTTVKSRFNVPEMVRILRGAMSESAASDSPVQVWLEQVHAMPEQGVTSSFEFGRGFGIWEGIIGTLGLPLNLVSPVRWKKAIMQDQGRAKDAAVYKASQLYPEAQLYGPKGGKMDGRAEALLIAHYGLGNINQGRE